jgi:DNA mismatch endonuclease (patch repair protein)
MDTLTPIQRSRLMGKVRRKDTKPELIVRRLVHSLGYRYRLHAGDLPGRPDLVFVCRHKVLFVHGCYWHRHSRCRKATTPTTNREFWSTKFAANKARDRRDCRRLRRAGWNVVVVWECETSNPRELTKRLIQELGVH